MTWKNKSTKKNILSARIRQFYFFIEKRVCFISKKILIIDDSNTIRQQVSFVLKKGGYQVIEAENGLMGIKILKEEPDISLVICDVNMPEMNGLTMVKVINESNDIQHPPILILTTEASAESMAEAKKYGAKGWIVKPFNPEMLIEGIKKLLA